MAFPRRLSKQTGNFKEGTAAFHTKGDDCRDFVAFVPLEGWLAYVKGDPAGLADRLERVARELLSRWHIKNLGLVGNERRPVAWYDEVCRCEWKGPTGKRETTIWEVQLNTWHLTQRNLDKRVPVVTLDDVKFLLKARSSLNADTRPDKSNQDQEGLTLDSKGYNKELIHLLGFLRSPGCLAQIQQVVEEREALRKTSLVSPSPAVAAAAAPAEEKEKEKEQEKEEEEEEAEEEEEEEEELQLAAEAAPRVPPQVPQ